MNIQRILSSAFAAVFTVTFAMTALAHPVTPKANDNAKTFTFSDKVGKNQLEWTSTAPAETITGTAEGVTGWLKFDPAHAKTITGTVSASVATMKSGNDMRDDHMKSEMWLNAGKYPTITFTAKKAVNFSSQGNKTGANIVGTFTMHGISQEMSVPVEITYLKANAETAKRAPGDLVAMTATFTVSLKDFGVTGKEGLIGSKVGETITIKAKLFAGSGL